MAKITLKGNPIQTVGELPKTGTSAPDFNLVNGDLQEVSLAQFAGKKKLLNIFPSVDTGTCAASVRMFNQKAAGLNNTVVLCISADLPFAQKRFCASEGINNVVNLSAFRSTFADDYGIRFADSPLKGLCSRAVVILDENNKVLYTQQVSETTAEPDYDSALAALK